MTQFAFEQLPLAVRLQDSATWDNLLVTEQLELPVSVVQNITRRQNEEWFACLNGPYGSGRSHLLQAACHEVSDSGQMAVYLPLAELSDYPPDELLQGLEQCDLVALDDLDEVLGRSAWEEQLFHLFNRCQQSGGRLLIAVSVPASELDIGLADLRSRLGWGVALQIRPLSDEQRIEALAFRANHRGMEISDEVARFLLLNAERDTHRIFALLDELDKQSLAQQRRLTIPFIKTVLSAGK